MAAYIAAHFLPFMEALAAFIGFTFAFLRASRALTCPAQSCSCALLFQYPARSTHFMRKVVTENLTVHLGHVSLLVFADVLRVDISFHTPIG